MKHLNLLLLCCLAYIVTTAQETFPVNGVADIRNDYFAFTNATVVKDPQTILQNATLVIKQGKIISVGTNITVPKDAAAVDCKGKYIYPSFIDLFSDYGVPALQSSPASSDATYQNISNTKGAYGWNQALKPETNTSKLFTANSDKAKDLRNVGFGTVLTHQQDGIARGTGSLVTLGTENEYIKIIYSEWR